MPDESIWKGEEPPRRPGVEAEDEFLVEAGLADDPGPLSKTETERLAENLTAVEAQPLEEELPPEPQPRPQAGSHPVAQQAYTGELPQEVEEIWGGGKVDGSGLPAINMARMLIGQWGLDVFLNSSLHRQAILDATRETEMEPLRAAYLKAMKQKEKK
jgi:hypothetical protein